MLESCDLADDKHNADLLRWLHVRYLHGTWGIVLGFQVVSTGSFAVRVQAGYALDVHGRDLLLTSDLMLTVPSVPDPSMLLLIMRYQTDCEYHSLPDLRALCVGTVVEPLLDRPAFEWKLPRQVHPGDDVLLARVHISGGGIQGAPDTSVQRLAQSQARPRLVTDSTEAGYTGWRLLHDKASGMDLLEARVDTSASGFLRTPAYFAQASPGVGFISVAAHDHFTYRIASPSADAAAAERAGWKVTWTAVELAMVPLFLLPILIKLLSEVPHV
jgi:hypothetical protein